MYKCPKCLDETLKACGDKDREFYEEYKKLIVSERLYEKQVTILNETYNGILKQYDKAGWLESSYPVLIAFICFVILSIIL